ncbi:hypothetical protein [Pedomonas mirosovicensis]|uniref:hypothetical protein n=1 Tax=Pedomonas mirosovicensis TaxID=2908641 RepID=UPI002169B8BE|nr:hypothetical protein [Pedomonas mirosovicensis]MCH8684975.1 hypothetical protein [Pedomonas mirosovicensis]
MTTPPELMADDIAEPVLWSARPEAKWTTFDVLVETMDARAMRRAVGILLLCVAGLAIAILAALFGLFLSAGEALPSGYDLALYILAALVISFFIMGLMAVPVMRRLHPPIYFALTGRRIGRRLGKTGPWDDFAMLDEVEPIMRWQSPGGFRGIDFVQSRHHPERGLLHRIFQVGGLGDEDAHALEAQLKAMGHEIVDRPELPRDARSRRKR